MDPRLELHRKKMGMIEIGNIQILSSPFFVNLYSSGLNYGNWFFI